MNLLEHTIWTREMQLPTAAASSKWQTLPIWLKLCLLNSATGTVLRKACFTSTGHKAEHSFQVLAALGDILNGTDEISLSSVTSSPAGCRGQRCCSLSAPTQQTTLPGSQVGTGWVSSSNWKLPPGFPPIPGMRVLPWRAPLESDFL